MMHEFLFSHFAFNLAIKYTATTNLNIKLKKRKKVLKKVVYPLNFEKSFINALYFLFKDFDIYYNIN